MKLFRIPWLKQSAIILISGLIIAAIQISAASTLESESYLQREINRRIPILEKSGKKPAVFLLHGFAGSPIDLEPLIKEIDKQGYAYKAVILPGHGTSPKDLENTPGVNAFVYSKFREHGINIVEQISCWTDTIVVISEDDIATVMKFLKF